MSCIRIAVIQLSGEHVSPSLGAIERTVAKAHNADLVALDLFSSQSAAPGVLTALSRLHRPVRVVGASAHWKRMLKISRLDNRFHIIEQAQSLCPPAHSPGLQCVELQLNSIGQGVQCVRERVFSLPASGSR